MGTPENLKSTGNQWLVNVWIVRIIRLSILVVGWSAILVFLVLSEFDPDIFSPYTVQSNVIVLSWLFVALIFQERNKGHWFFSGVIRGGITLYITITFLIFAILLTPYYHPTGIEGFANIIVHYLVPIAFIVDWILTEMYHEYPWKYIIFWLAYPIFYLIFTLIRATFTGNYIYPFLDLNSMGIGIFIMWIFILAAVFLLLGALLVFINKKIGKRFR